MKIETTITIEADLLTQIESFGNRSEIVEKMLREFVERKRQQTKPQLTKEQEIEIINRHADALNKEAKDVLDYQTEW